MWYQWCQSVVVLYLLYINKLLCFRPFICPVYCIRLQLMHLLAHQGPIECSCAGWWKHFFFFYSQYFIFLLPLRQQMLQIQRNHRISHPLCICIFLSLTAVTLNVHALGIPHLLRRSPATTTPLMELFHRDEINQQTYFQVWWLQTPSSAQAYTTPRENFQQPASKPTIYTHASHALIKLRFQIKAFLNGNSQQLHTN